MTLARFVKNLDRACREEKDGSCRLIYAELGDALGLLITYDRKSEKDREAARRWIAERGSEPWTFEFCCEAVSLDPSYVRKLATTAAPSATGRAPT